MFSLNCFLDLSNGRPGMLVPLISSPNTNLPYVQQMDEFFLVREIVPFLEYENYPVVPSADTHMVSIGDLGLVAFRAPDDSIFCGNVTETLAYLKGNEELISRNPMLRSQLNRIESAELQPSYDAWRKVADVAFDNTEQKKFWLDSELRIFQKQKQIWRDIDRIESSVGSTKGTKLQGSLAEYGPEFLIKWLAKRSNFEIASWTTVWHHVNVALPFDERVAQVGITWMYAQVGEDHDFQQSKSILFALLQRRQTKEVDWKGLAEILSERLSSEPYLIYNFLMPKKLFRALFIILANEGFADDVLNLVEFCISNVPKDEHVIEVLEVTLSSILDERLGEGQLARPIATDHKQVETARALLLRLRELPNRATGDVKSFYTEQSRQRRAR
jgi:hypothetical protein